MWDKIRLWMSRLLLVVKLQKISETEYTQRQVALYNFGTENLVPYVLRIRLLCTVSQSKPTPHRLFVTVYVIFVWRNHPRIVKNVVLSSSAFITFVTWSFKNASSNSPSVVSFLHLKTLNMHKPNALNKLVLQGKM
jgi:hypothetical protein